MNIFKTLTLVVSLSFSQLVFSETFTPDPISFGITVDLKDKSKIEDWFKKGLDPNFQDGRLGSGLMIAAWNGDIEMMDLFLKNGADVNFTNKNGEQALLHASFKGQLDAVKWLIEHGAKINREEEKQWSALHYAAFGGHDKVFDFLINNNADINAKSTNGSSVLMMAVYEGQDKIVDKLVNLGANKAIKNDWGDGALEWAVKYEKFNIAKKVAPTEKDFIDTVNKPKDSWGKVFKSQKSPIELEKLMYEEMLLKSNGQDLTEIKSRIAQFQRKTLAESFQKAKAKQEEKEYFEVVVTAKRGNANDQKMEIKRRGN